MAHAAAPVNGGVSPSAPSTLADVALTLTATYSDADGVADISQARLLVDTGTDAVNALYGFYDAVANKLYLYDNDSTTLLGGFAPGSANVISNSQGSLNCAQTTVSTSGNTLTVNWSFTPNSSFLGTKNTYSYVRDLSNVVDSWDNFATWTISATAPTPTPTAVPTPTVRPTPTAVPTPTPTSIPKPPTPTGLTATAGNAQVTLSWTASAGATSYTVRRSTINGSGYVNLTPNVTGTSFTNTGLTNGTTYYYVVRANNAGSSSGDSNQSSAVPQAPFVFTNITNGQVLSESITVRVSVNSPSIQEYGDLTLSVLNASGQVIDTLKTSSQGIGTGRPAFFVLSTFYYANGAVTLRLDDGNGYQDSRGVVLDNDVFNFNRDGVFDVTGGGGSVPTSASITATIKSIYSGWKVTISDLDSNIVKTFTGSGASVNVVWDGTNSAGVQVEPQCYQLQITPITSGSSVQVADNRLRLVDWNPHSSSKKQSNFRLVQATPKPILSWLNKNVPSDVMVLLSRDVFPGGMPSLISYAKFINGQLATRKGNTYYGPIQIFVTDAKIVNASAAVRNRINSLLSARKVLVYVDAEGGELPYPYFAVGSYSWYSRNPPATPNTGIIANYDVSALTAPLSYGNPDGLGGADPPTLVWMDHCRSLGDDGGSPVGTGEGPPVGGLNPWRWDWSYPFGIGNATDTSNGGTLLGVGGTLTMYGAYAPPADTWDQWRVNMWSRLFAGGKNFITSFNQTNSITPSVFPFPDNPQNKYNWYGDSLSAF